jgi:hypothetical protein
MSEVASTVRQQAIYSQENAICSPLNHLCHHGRDLLAIYDSTGP